MHRAPFQLEERLLAHVLVHAGKATAHEGDFRRAAMSVRASWQELRSDAGRGTS
jgi:hypothetical protein